jgi:hypothetical protein
VTNGSEASPNWLPPILAFDWNDYNASLDRAYAIFLRDFGDSRRLPSFLGKRLAIKRHPELDGKSATFWHLITEGKNEQNRTPVSSRIERIGWPRAVIESASDSTRVCCWPVQRGGAKRWNLAIEDFTYLVVMDDRGDYALLWTAYAVDYENNRRRLSREYESSRA